MKTLHQLKTVVTNLKNVSSIATLQTELLEFCNEFQELEDKSLEFKVLFNEHTELEKEFIQLELELKQVDADYKKLQEVNKKLKK